MTHLALKSDYIYVSFGIQFCYDRNPSTDAYKRWFSKLRDKRAKARIDVRIRRLSLGNPGDVEPVGEGVSELRIDYGPGYRVYYLSQGDELIVLLAGGDKSSQSSDIKKAKSLAAEL